MNATNETSIDLSSLRSGLAEPVVAPGDEGYDEARQAWALLADPRPAAVAFPTGPVEVAAAVRFARANGLRVALQATGHGASPLESLEHALLVKTTHMTGLEIDPAGRRARAEAGVLWGDVVAAVGAEGLACLHGSSSDTGVIGYTLGGGIGWYSRRYGLAGNSVLAVEAVTAEGELVRCDAETEPDLFWALRGGGGAFAAVTALEFSLYPVGDLYAGWLVFEADRLPGGSACLPRLGGGRARRGHHRRFGCCTCRLCRRCRSRCATGRWPRSMASSWAPKRRRPGCSRRCASARRS